MTEEIIEIQIQDNKIDITGSISLQLNVSPQFNYMGNQEIILYDIARAHQYIFADYSLSEENDKQISQILYIQYEYYLPGIDSSYNYESTDIVDLDGIPFKRDNFIGRSSKEGHDPKSDTYQLITFLEDRDCIMEEFVWTNRLVTMLNEEKTQELLIGILEAVPTDKLENLFHNGELVEETWENGKPGLQERGLETFTIH